VDKSWKANKTNRTGEIFEMKNKTVVMSSYPKAECREVTSPSGSYFMIYDLGGIAPNLIGYDMATEEKAWDMAASRIGTAMLNKLEKE
jgi:hypothetical protein